MFHIIHMKLKEISSSSFIAGQNIVYNTWYIYETYLTSKSLFVGAISGSDVMFHRQLSFDL